ncbi:MAG: hypothetical protein PUF65_06705 [Lachnospiraceae bacterium]|nr:hypothetical protein [Lachnospiraceae bacterium]
MPVGPINYAMIQRMNDVESIKHQEDAKPMVDQQNIQGQVENRADQLRHQVLQSQDSDKTDNHTDAREEGKNKYSGKRNGQKKDKNRKEDGRVIQKQSSGFDIKI